MTALLKAALEYARRGIPVFPVKPKGKTTVTDHGFKDATTDEKTIRAWWKKWLNANIGLYPGGAGLVVVDVDGPAGMAFAKKCGWLDIPTPRVITKKGLHLYFQKTSKGVISNAKPHPKIDIRSDNGYVLAPPSIHPSGHVYVWENQELEFAPLPRGVLRALEDRKTSAPVKDGKITEGQRNTRLTSYGGGLRRLGASVSGIRSALLTLNESECDPPLSSREAKRIASSVAKYAPAPSRRIIERINTTFAFVMNGGQSAVIWIKDRMKWDLLRFVDFRRLLQNWDWVRVGKQKKPVHPADYWLRNKERAEYRAGIVFEPGKTRTPGTFNIFRGWPIERKKGGKFNLFLDHIRDNICQGDPELYTWVVMWIAHIFQEPDRKIGTALVLRGKQGVGKTILGRVIGHLLGPYYKIVASARYLIGNFNSHLENALLLQAEEAFWAGEKDAEGTLKDLITSETNQIERKYHEPVQVANHVRVLITSNENWIIPAGRDDRRFAVLDVGDAQRNNHVYFGKMMRQLEENDGYAALLDFFLTKPVDEAVIRKVPSTAARTEQKHHSLSIDEECWLDILTEGVLPYDLEGEGRCLSAALITHFEEKTRWSKGRKAMETRFGNFLKRIAPGVDKVRTNDPDSKRRHYFYEFPPLSECRRAFDADADWAEPREWQRYEDPE